MFEILFEFPKNFKEAKRISEETEIKIKSISSIRNIVISGMGGSGFSGDFILSLFRDSIKIPIIVSKYYSLPEFVNDETLLILVSYSGNTEETLSSLEDGVKRGANIIAISSDGQLEEIVKGKYTFFKIPEGYPPRMALPFLFYPIYYTLRNFTEENFGEEEFFESLPSLYEPFKEKDNEAKRLAEAIYGKIPVIYSSFSLKPVALRWKQEINENSKNPAYDQYFPELNHNETVSWDSNLFKEEIIFIILRDQYDSERMRKRIDISKEFLKERGWKFIEYKSSGRGKLTNLFSLIPLGDFTSIYLSLLNSVEAKPVKIIEELKRRLKS